MGRDNDFYLDFVMAAASVLDVGCGTGMLLKRAREAGHTGRLTGLDPAEAMLDQARGRLDVEWIHGSLSDTAFRGEFELVVMTGHVFQVFLTDEEIRAALQAVREAGGRFAFETRNPLVRPCERWIGSEQVTAADGSAVTAANTSLRMLDGGVVEVTGSFTSPGWGREVLCPSSFRFVEAEVLDRFLAEAGFTVAERYGDWDRSRSPTTSPRSSPSPPLPPVDHGRWGIFDPGSITEATVATRRRA